MAEPLSSEKMAEFVLERKGMLSHYRRKVHEYVNISGFTRARARQQAQIDFGYPTKASIEYEYRMLIREDEIIAGGSEYTEQELKEAKRREEAAFNHAVAGLPPNAAVTDEICWIRRHPAMRRRYTQEDPEEYVKLTVEDVLSSTAGPAPSASAVNALAHWANHVAEFHKQLISEDKKKSSDGKGQDTLGEENEDLDEVAELLNSIELDLPKKEAK